MKGQRALPGQNSCYTNEMSVAPSQPSSATAKEKVRAVLDQLPDYCTIDAVQYRLYVAELVSQRSAELDAGASVVSQEEAERRMEKC